MEKIARECVGAWARLGVGILLAACTFAACTMGAALAQTPAPTQMQFQSLAGGWSGDGGMARAANLHGIADVAIDGAGNLYIAQTWGNRIRKVATNGVITTLVGGETGFAGDNGHVSQALINHPTGLVLDASGNLYFSDSGNHRVRRIAPNGVITTVAGNGSATTTGDFGYAVYAGVHDPSGLAFDAAGNLYIAERKGHVVRRVATNGVISTYAGLANAPGFAGDGGPATFAQLSYPEGLDFDSAGNLFIADTNNSRVRRVATNGTIASFADSFTVTYPYNVEVDAADNIFIASADCTLVKFPKLGTLKRYGVQGQCGMSPDGTPATSASIGVPDGIAVDAVGNVFFSDTDNARLARIDNGAGAIWTHAGTKPWVPNGTAGPSATLSLLTSLAVDAAGNIAFSDSLFAHYVRKYATTGQVTALGGNGTMHFTPCAGTCAAVGFALPFVTGVAFGPGGVLYVADRSANRIFRIAPDGTLATVAGGGSGTGENVPATQIAIDPYGVAVDSQGNVYFADFDAHRVRRITPDGKVATIAGNGAAGFAGDGGAAANAQLNSPNAVAVDALDNVYISDYGNRRVRKVARNGVIRTIAGNGAIGIGGDGGPATNAALGYVTGLAAHANGIYLAEDGHLRRVKPDGTIERVQGWRYSAYGVAIRNGQLHVATDSGRLLRAWLPLRASHDADGNRISDVFWRNAATGQNIGWRDAVKTQSWNLGTMPVAYTLAAQGDLDGDGRTDVLWRNPTTGGNIAWRSANPATPLAMAAVPGAWSVAGVADFDGDGVAYVIWRSKVNGANVAWKGGQSNRTKSIGAMADLRWVVAAIGDFDGDGRADLLWRNPGTGANEYWSAGNAAARVPITGVTNIAWKIAGAGDFNGDGVSDLLWRNGATGQNTIWLSANGTTQMSVKTSATTWSVAAIGTYDGDHVSDILWRNTNGSNVLWRNGNAATPLAVPAVGTAWQFQPREGQP